MDQTLLEKKFQSNSINNIDELVEEYYRWIAFYTFTKIDTEMCKRRLKIMIMEFIEKSKNK